MMFILLHPYTFSRKLYQAKNALADNLQTDHYPGRTSQLAQLAQSKPSIASPTTFCAAQSAYQPECRPQALEPRM